jgi:hypothetical protein
MSHIVHLREWLAESELGLAQIGVALVSRVQSSQSQRLVSTADAAQQVLSVSKLTNLHHPQSHITQIALPWNGEPFLLPFQICSTHNCVIAEGPLISYLGISASLPSLAVYPPWSLLLLGKSTTIRVACTMSSGPPSVELEQRRKRLRKGTRSCWECKRISGWETTIFWRIAGKRRKIRCQLSSEDVAVCSGCVARG